MALLKGIGGIAAAILLILAILVVFYVVMTYIGVLANFGLLIPLAAAAVLVLTVVHLVRRRGSVVARARENRPLSDAD